MIAAIYSRVSTTKEEQKDSLCNQEEIIRDVIKRKGWEPYHYVYKESKSGTKANRTEISKLLSDAKSGKFQVIIAKELSRLARNQEFAMNIIKQLKVIGVHLVTLDGAIDTTKDSSDVTGLFSWLYEFESAKMSQRIKKVIVQKYKSGKFLGSVPPYGYFVRDNKLFIRDDETPEVIRHIFRLFQEGKGFDKIARTMYDKSIPSPSQVAGKKNATPIWHGSSVRSILENRNYTGDLVQGKETNYDITIMKRKAIPPSEHIVVENTHEAIINKDEFYFVQNLIKKRRKPTQNNALVSTKPHEIIHPFTELLVCGECGKHFHYKGKKSNEYICGLYNKLGRKACSPKAISENDLKEVIKKDLQAFSDLVDREKLYAVFNVKQREREKKVKTRINGIKQKLNEIEKKKILAMDRLLEKVFTEAQFKQYIESLDSEILSLHQELMGLENASQQQSSDLKLDKMKKMVDDALAFNDWSRATLNRFVDKIVVNDSEHVEIHYSFSSTQTRLNDLMDLTN